MRTPTASVSIFLILAGCVLPTENLSLLTTFDPNAVAFVNQNGSGVIKGEAFLRQGGGGVVTCAGYNVALVPSAAYADERISLIYKSKERGFNPVFRRFTNTQNVDYLSYTRATKCDAQGKFQFRDLHSGAYYVTAQVTWVVGGVAQGGTLMEKAQVVDDKTVELLLTQ